MWCNIPVKDVKKVNTVIGIGTTIHKFVDANVKYVFLPFIHYHLPTTDVRLFYPQTYHHTHGVNNTIKILNVKMVPKNHNIVIKDIFSFLGVSFCVTWNAFNYIEIKKQKHRGTVKQAFY